MENKIKEPIKLIFLTIIFAYLLSFIPENTELLGIKLKHVDIIGDLKTKEEKTDKSDNTDKEYEEYMKEYQKMLEEEKDSSQSKEGHLLSAGNVNFASMNFLGTANLIADQYGKKPRKQISTKEQKIMGNLRQLKYFFDALKKSKKNVVRIAHFGDSGIEGDLMTADFREVMQSKFGGKGVGWVSITKQDASFRMSTKMTFSNNWESATLYTSNPKNLPLGISGEIFVPKGKAWTQFETTRYYPHIRNFKTARLFYISPRRTEIEYSFDNKPVRKVKLKRGDSIHELTLTTSRAAKKLRLTMPDKAGYFFGVSLENGNGIYIDNFPLRGNSGVDINQIPISQLKDFSKYLDYELIMLEFGLNAIGMIKRNYTWYVREMVNVIKHLKEAYPHASFLMIGIHDKSSRRGGKFMSDPAIFKLLKAQLEIVKKSNIAYWNLFEAMGGKNSMHKWVLNNPPLASHDHLHFNLNGAKIISKMLIKALLDADKRIH